MLVEGFSFYSLKGVYEVIEFSNEEGQRLVMIVDLCWFFRVLEDKEKVIGRVRVLGEVVFMELFLFY